MLIIHTGNFELILKFLPLCIDTNINSKFQSKVSWSVGLDRQQNGLFESDVHTQTKF